MLFFYSGCLFPGFNYFVSMSFLYIPFVTVSCTLYMNPYMYLPAFLTVSLPVYPLHLCECTCILPYLPTYLFCFNTTCSIHSFLFLSFSISLSFFILFLSRFPFFLLFLCYFICISFFPSFSLCSFLTVPLPYSVTRPGPGRDTWPSTFHVSCRRGDIDAGRDSCGEKARRRKRNIGTSAPPSPVPTDKCTKLHIFDSYHNFMGEVERKSRLQNTG